jgi:iron complex outermembrane receptor protein
MLVGVNSRGSRSLEADLQRPLPDQRLTVSAGFGYTHDEKFFGNNSEIYSAALVGRWRPSNHLEISPFWAWLKNDEEEVAPVIFGTGDRLPRRIERRRFFGQSWAKNTNAARQLGVIARADLGLGVAARGGVGYSTFVEPRRYADLFQGVDAAGVATRPAPAPALSQIF